LLQALSITLGIALLLHALNHFVSVPFFTGNNFTFSIYRKLQTFVLPLIDRGSVSSAFLLGIMNGLLPCGLVYLGLAGAMASGSWFYGLVFMGGFGLGTVPVMLFLSLGWMNLSGKFRLTILRIIPGLQFAMALLLILRGLNLGVPYLSPQWPSLNKAQATQVCHVP
jgi:sulfite exporter TauE/SafE